MEESKITIAGTGLLASLTDPWGGRNETEDSITVHGHTVPAGCSWGINRGEIERYVKSVLARMENDRVELGLTASPAILLVGATASVTLQATTSASATAIRVRMGSTELGSGSGTSLSVTHGQVPTGSPSTLTYTAEFVINGETKSCTRTVSIVNKIYYGSGDTYADASSSPSARVNPYGTYTVNVAQDGQYIFFNVPATMQISKATLNGFSFPLDAAQSVTIDNASYKSYRSSNPVDAGTYQIVIS